MSTVTVDDTPVGIYNFNVVQGADFRVLLIWKDQLDVPIDNTNYTARMQVRTTVEDDEVVVTLATSENLTAEGLITLDGISGEILLELDATETAAMPATPFDRRWRYDLEMVASSGFVRRILMGRWIVSPEVTR